MKNKSKESLSLLAYLYLEHFKYDKALSLLQALYILHPKDVEIIRSLAYAFLKNRDYQSALKYAEKCLRKEPSKNIQLSANIIKSKALWGLGKEEAARHTFTQIIPQIKVPEKTEELNPTEEA